MALPWNARLCPFPSRSARNAPVLKPSPIVSESDSRRSAPHARWGGRSPLEALKAAGDVFADRLPHRGCVARFKRADNVLVLAYESLHIAWPTAIGRARELL